MEYHEKAKFLKFKHLSCLFYWAIVIATLIFVGKAFYDNWREVKSLQIQDEAWYYAVAALGVSLFSHCWSGILWGGILRNLQHRVPWRYALVTFLATEIAKYLPGDVWQVYGRLQAARKIGVPITVGIAATLLQSVYLATAGIGFGLIVASHPTWQGLYGLGLVCLLVSVHPRMFDRAMRGIERLPKRSIVQRILGRFPRHQWYRPRMKCYPLLPILGQFLFLGLRGISFVLTVLVFTSVDGRAIAPLISGFGLAWALGVVSPISGGVGVFEATAIALLDGVISSSCLLGAVILYRLLALMTEAIGAGLGLLLARRLNIYP